VGGVSGRAGVEAGGSDPSANAPPRVVTVKGILVLGTAALFAGRRPNENLGRSVAPHGYPPVRGVAPTTADVRRSPRRGTSSRMRHKAHAPGAARITVRAPGDTSFARSFDPCASILTIHGGVKSVVRGGAFTSVSRLGKPTRVGRTSTGAIRTDVVRLATCHRSREGEGVTREKRKEVEASVPARIKSSGWVARTSCFQLQKSVGDGWPRISSANAPQKGRSGSSERGPSSAFRSAGETVGGGVERRVGRGSDSPLKTGEDRRKAQGGARVPSSGRDIAESGAAVAGPGL
jgi:hypothetical protein